MTAFRLMRREDIDRGLALCRSAGWNQLSRDWAIFLELSPHCCYVATIQGKVVGTVTTVRYEHSFSWIGMVLVDTGYRGKGIGTELLHEALRILKKEETVKLDATPAGGEIYLKLGFKDEYQISRMTAAKLAVDFVSTKARIISEADLHSITDFDKMVFGADRKELLGHMLEGAPGCAFMIEEENGIQGYCFSRHGCHFTHIGPVVAKSREVAKELVLSALSNLAHMPVMLDVTLFDPAWAAWLGSLGFTEQRKFTRMYRGSNSSPGMPEKQFAILGPEFG